MSWPPSTQLPARRWHSQASDRRSRETKSSRRWTVSAVTCRVPLKETSLGGLQPHPLQFSSRPSSRGDGTVTLQVMKGQSISCTRNIKPIFLPVKAPGPDTREAHGCRQWGHPVDHRHLHPHHTNLQVVCTRPGLLAGRSSWPSRCSLSLGGPASTPAACVERHHIGYLVAYGLMLTMFNSDTLRPAQWGSRVNRPPPTRRLAFTALLRWGLLKERLGMGQGRDNRGLHRRLRSVRAPRPERLAGKPVTVSVTGTLSGLWYAGWQSDGPFGLPAGPGPTGRPCCSVCLRSVLPASGQPARLGGSFPSQLSSPCGTHRRVFWKGVPGAGSSSSFWRQAPPSRSDCTTLSAICHHPQLT